jgi:predicted MFS family arabinose efflux permease
MAYDIVQDRQEAGTPRYAWVILGITFLAAICASSLMDRAAPVIPDLMAEFGVGLSTSGLLMSAFGLTGLALTLPAGFILQRLGMKTGSTIAFGFLIAGVAIGALSNGFGLLLFSRMLEGIGNALIYVMTPAVIAMWFPPEKRGMPLGVWASATPVGSILTMMIIPRLAASMGWRGAWWISGLFTVLVFIAFRVLIRPAPVESDPVSEEVSSFRRLLDNKFIWLVGLSWFLIVAVSSSLYTFYPTFLVEEAGYTMIKAGSLFSLVGFLRIILNPLAGWFSDTIGSRRLVGALGAAAYLPVFLLLFLAPHGMIPVLMVLMGIFISIVPVMIIASVPDAAGDPKMVPLGMAVVQFGFNLSIVLAPPTFGGLVERLGWTSAAWIFTPLILLAIVSILVNKKIC